MYIPSYFYTGVMYVGIAVFGAWIDNCPWRKLSGLLTSVGWMAGVRQLLYTFLAGWPPVWCSHMAVIAFPFSCCKSNFSTRICTVFLLICCFMLVRDFIICPLVSLRFLQNSNVLLSHGWLYSYSKFLSNNFFFNLNS